MEAMHINIEDPQSLNLYSYVLNNPVTSTDPDGDWPGWCLFWCSQTTKKPLPVKEGGVLDDLAVAAKKLKAAYDREQQWMRDHPNVTKALVIASAIGGGAESAEGEGFGIETSTPVGRSGNPMDVTPGTNAASTINGRGYSGHALDEMQGEGIPSSVIENTIQHGVGIAGKIEGTVAHYDPVNNISVITDASAGRVVTVSRGYIKQ